MPPIHVSGWLVLAIILYAAVISAACSAGRDTAAKVEGRKYRRLWIVSSFMGVFLICTTVFNVLSYGFSMVTSESSVTQADVAKEFGLNPGQAYPLVLGERLGGAAGHATARAGLFTAQASVSLQPASALSVSFTRGAHSYILELPVSKVTFEQRTDVDPTMKIYFSNTSTSLWKEEEYGPCRTVIESGFLVCWRTITYTTVLDADTQRRGLGPVVANGLDSATIVLTPEMYRQVLGQNK